MKKWRLVGWTIFCLPEKSLFLYFTCDRFSRQINVYLLKVFHWESYSQSISMILCVCFFKTALHQIIIQIQLGKKIPVFKRYLIWMRSGIYRPEITKIVCALKTIKMFLSNCRSEIHSRFLISNFASCFNKTPIEKQECLCWQVQRFETTLGQTVNLQAVLLHFKWVSETRERGRIFLGYFFPNTKWKHR